MIVKQITLLNETVLKCLNETNEIKIVKAFIEVGLSVLGGNFGFVWLNSVTSNSLSLVYKSSNTPFEPHTPRQGGRNYNAIKFSKPDFVSDVRKNKDAHYVRKFAKSFVIIPLTYKGGVYGTMVMCFKKKQIFTVEKKSLCVFIGNSVAQAITIGRLVSSEKRAHLESQRNEAYFRALIENSYEVIVLVSLSGVILYISQSVEKVFGHKVSNVVGKKIEDLIYQGEPKKIRVYLKKILKQPHGDNNIEFLYISKNGSIRTMAANAINMLSNKNVGGIVINVRDITEQKNTEKLKETELLLNEEKLKTEFIANATHEFRTPLSIIKGNTELALLSDAKEIKSVKDELDAINDEADHLSSLISDLALLTYKTEALQKIVMNDTVNLTDLILNTAKRFKTMTATKKISINIKKVDSVYVRGDTEYLNKLFVNLIKNSISYGKVGGWISIEITKQENSVDVRIKDDGVGISPEDLPKVFERFYTTDKARTRGDRGTGLGLAIVKWVVLSHKGTITVDSKTDKGTTFVVTFPTLE